MQGAIKVFFRKIFILQLVGLVLTYNFTDCDFDEIKKMYQNVFFPALKNYMNGMTSTEFDHLECKDQPDCLAQIERVTFTPTHGCLSLAKETFAVGTKTTFILKCPGYSGLQMNKTQATKKRKRREVPTNECLEQVSNLLELWRHFSRFPRKQHKS